MSQKDFANWLLSNHSRFKSLTDAVMSIIANLLIAEGVSYLTVSGRTKDQANCLEKVKRKNYNNPQVQMTDISGIRIIVYFEHDVDVVSRIISDSFRVDKKNSVNRDSVMLANEIGYRSAHFVCDLGDVREKLPEFATLAKLKFEFQVRTVLQHAWAELAHDRNYKFSGKLPKLLERKLFLLAGMLEMADGGFSELSKQFDNYMRSVSESAAEGSLDIELNSPSLTQFVKEWSQKNNLDVEGYEPKDGYADLLKELKQYGIRTLSDLNSIIPLDFAENYKNNPFDSGLYVYGLIRTWMIISDLQKFLDKVKVEWKIYPNDLQLFKKYFNKEQFQEMQSKIGFESEERE